jgi:hypothetical protein
VPSLYVTRKKANQDREAGASRQPIASAWYFTAPGEATEAKLSAIAPRVAN